MQRTLLVGDVHGCLDELQALLTEAAVGPGDRVVLVGDLTSKGPDSQGVLQLARERGFLAVLGNHDDAVLRARQPDAAARPPKEEHLRVAASLSAEDWRWLGSLPLTLALPELNVLVVHAGLVPGVPLDRQRRADLLLMRSLTPDGRGTRHAEEGPPWAAAWRGPEHVVFGHDAVRGVQLHPFATGLDSGCVYGRALTGLLLPERRLVQVPARRAYVEL